MITCNRCGKENQDHYKFCLGCGNEIKAAAAGAPALAGRPAAAPAPAPSPVGRIGGGGTPIGTAPTMIPPDPLAVAPTPTQAHPAASGLPGMSAPAQRPAMASPAVATGPTSKPSGGIPWGDSPKMPASHPFGQQAGAQVAVAPQAVRPAPTPGPFPGPAPAPAAAPRPAPVATPAPAAIACPNCGREVKPGFAFCGSCGARIAGAGADGHGAEAVARERTMFGGQAGAVAAAPQPRGRLVLIRPDGTEGGVHPLRDGENLIGRGQGTLFDTDAYLSPRHAEFVITPGGLVIRDLRSLNGVFVKIQQEEPLASADIFRIGQELLRFDVIAPPIPMEDGTEVMGTPNPGFWGRLSVIVSRDVDGSAFPLFGEAIVLGRERGDILFPEDGYVSGTHARISLKEAPGGHTPYLADLGSSNGTFLRVRGERTITTGTFALMGQQLFRVEYR